MRPSVLAICLLVVFSVLCSAAFGPRASAANSDDEEKSIQLPVLPSDLPEGKGLATVNAACTICHSTRYISMQPAFPRKSWAATVDKMRKTFGAPMSDEQAAEAVDYLVAIKGVREQPVK